MTVEQLDRGPLSITDLARQIAADLVNAGKVPVTETMTETESLEASHFHHADSFAMMRGGHLDVCVLGASDAIPAVSGAMDLAIGAKQILVMMTLFDKESRAKLVPSCTYPLTGVGCVSRVYTDLATFDLTPGGVLVTAMFGTTVEELRTCLGLPLLAD